MSEVGERQTPDHHPDQPIWTDLERQIGDTSDAE